VLKSAAGTLLALTVTGIVSPAGMVTGAVSGVGGVLLPGPSAAERSVDSLYEEVKTSEFWTSPPTMSTASKRVLIDDWESLRIDMPHRFPARGAEKVGLGDLFQDRSFDGRRVVGQGYVAQVFPVEPLAGRGDLVTAARRLSIAEEREVAWCGRGTYPRDLVPQEDQLVDVVGVPAARGPANVASGGFTIGIYLVCSGVRPLVEADDATEVASLFEAEEGDRMWLSPPSLSGRARHFLMREWDRLTPYRPHPYPTHRVKRTGIDRVREDVRFDARLLAITGYVTQRLLQPGGEGMTLERTRLQLAGQGNAIWCRTTLQNWRVFDEGDLVEAVGVPIARGSAKLEDGGFDNVTSFVCPAMRRR